MLVLSRRKGQRIRIGPSIEIEVVRISSDTVRIGIEAPPEIRIDRAEHEAAFLRAKGQQPGGGERV